MPLHVDDDKPASSSKAKCSTEKSESTTKLTGQETVASGSSTKFSDTICTKTTVVLSTAIIHVRHNLGKLQAVRVLLDSSSKVSTITSECATRLGLKRIKSRIEVTGLSEQPVNKIKRIFAWKSHSFIHQVSLFLHISQYNYPVTDYLLQHNHLVMT